ncbi:unnamed protein product [Owenia fusiformis]|uniref:Uncharacterized protein n=1 Tax=Owenia fusiformis TaxID=6347 RepID=A0A8S4P8Y1_OWEFU|nr:unnamed protein product [Owenia fusiformis]
MGICISVGRRTHGFSCLSLHEAAIRGHVDCLVFLLELGNGVNALQPENGKSPLDLAIQYHRDECTKEILSRGGRMGGDILIDLDNIQRPITCQQNENLETILYGNQETERYGFHGDTEHMDIQNVDAGRYKHLLARSYWLNTKDDCAGLVSTLHMMTAEEELINGRQMKPSASNR